MALQTFPGGAWIPGPIALSGAGAAIFGLPALTAADHRVLFKITAPETGTLESFEFRLGSAAQAPISGLRISFQDVSAVDGYADGTQDHYCDITSGLVADAWIVPPHALTNDGTAGGSKRSVTRGDDLCCVIEFVSFALGDNVGISTLGIAPIGAKGLLDGNYYTALYTGSWGAKSPNAPVMGLKYSDGNYYPILPGVWPIFDTNTRTFNSGSAAPKRGLRFIVPGPCRFSGAWARIDLDGDATVVLYDASDTILSSVTLREAVRNSASGVNFSLLMPKVTLLPNVVYRLTVNPSSVTDIRFYDLDISSTSLMAACEGGAQWYSTFGTTGAWTDNPINRPLMGLLLDQFNEASGSEGMVWAPITIVASAGLQLLRAIASGAGGGHT